MNRRELPRYSRFFFVLEMLERLGVIVFIVDMGIFFELRSSESVDFYFFEGSFLAGSFEGIVGALLVMFIFELFIPKLRVFLFDEEEG